MDGDRHGAVLTNRVTSVTLIVPVLNEHAIVPALLEGLAALRPSPQEILICDGGSTDDTGARLEASGCRVLYGERGRARQMNAGARVARSDILVFLHADTRLPTDAVNRVCASLAADGALWGRFDVRIEGRSAMLRVVAAMMNLRSRLSGIATGDQAIFVKRCLFEAIGGWPDQPLMEDIELSARLRKLSRPRRIASPVLTSGRRWESRGVWRTILLMWRLRWAYWLGCPADVLAERYR
ncbi:MAG TPA: TIGR04283 family arsenosugar biosynthesis glycosyltransferase [Gammaproteobacteria bacterium]|nr:TIGR04283 family arsenosugar biosynthesis glycosyltransferase [Gammaproteobacteria bacterium]